MRKRSLTNVNDLPVHKPGVVITIQLRLLIDYLTLYNLKHVSTRPDLTLIVKKKSTNDLQSAKRHLESTQDPR